MTTSASYETLHLPQFRGRKETNMKKVAFSGTVEEYQGKKLDKPIKYASGDKNGDGTERVPFAEAYETVAELKASEDFPGDSDILKFVNARKLTSAKAQAYQTATKDLKAQYEASPEYQRKNLIDAMLAMKRPDGTAMFNQAEAEAFAASKS